MKILTVCNNTDAISGATFPLSQSPAGWHYVDLADHTQLRIHNAFTPNGDGHNDVFYVLGGLQGTVIRRFTVFDRWGQLVFQAQDSQPGDASLGWNGNYRGAPCPTGAYVYFISVSLADGSINDYKGTVMLVR